MHKLLKLRELRNYEFIKSTVSYSSHYITTIPPGGILIDQPGTYTFINNIAWSPSFLLNTGIFIIASDVTINLNGFVFESIVNNTLSTGIFALNCRNICIKNGTIKNMGLIGANFIGVKNLTICGVTVSGLTLNNLIFPGFGISVILSEHVDIKNTTVKDIEITGLTLSAIFLDEVFDSKIHACCLSNLKNHAGVCAGLSQVMCDKSYSKKLDIRQLETGFVENLLAPGHTCIGIVPFLSVNLKYSNIKINNIMGSIDDAHLLSLFVVKNAVVKNVCGSDVIDGRGGIGAKATGIEVYGWTDINDSNLTVTTIRPPANIVVKNCHVSNIFAINPGNKQAAGFTATGSCIVFENCSASNVRVFNKDGRQDMATGLGVGFSFAPDIREIYTYPSYKIKYNNCVATNCDCGFDTFYHIKSLWQNIKSCNNGIDVLTINCSQRTFFCNRASECPDAPVDGFKYVTINNIARNNKICGIDIEFATWCGCDGVTDNNYTNTCGCSR